METNSELEVCLPQITRHRTSCDATLFFKEGFRTKPPLKKEVADCEAIRRRIYGDKLRVRVCLSQITRHRTSCDATLFFKEGFLDHLSKRRWREAPEDFWETNSNSKFISQKSPVIALRAMPPSFSKRVFLTSFEKGGRAKS